MWSCKNTWPKVSLTLWMKAAQGYSQSWQAGWPQALCQRRYNGFRLSHDLDVRKLISFIWVSSPRCTCFPNLVVRGLMEIAISILILVLTWIRWKKFFQIRNTDLQFRSSGDGWQKNEKKKENSTGNCKAFAFHVNAIMKPWL